MKVQLLTFSGCPNADAARVAARAALAAEQLELPIEEIDVEDAAAPDWARGWGSPTVLVDGLDVTGQGPAPASASAPASSCRLYAGGAPSVEAIRARLQAARAEPPARPARGVALPMIGAVTAALAASACCLIPAILAVIGVSGAGFAARFAPFRPYFLVATGVALAVGFWFAYRRRAADCDCGVPRSRRAARVGLWIATLIAAGLAVYPSLGNGNARAGSEQAPAKATLRLAVTGMDCKECTSTIANGLRRVPGVVSATVEFESGIAIVRHDGRDGVERASILAVEEAGFAAAVAR